MFAAPLLSRMWRQADSRRTVLLLSRFAHSRSRHHSGSGMDNAGGGISVGREGQGLVWRWASHGVRERGYGYARHA